MDSILGIDSASSTGFCFDPCSNNSKLVRTERFAKEFNKSPQVELYSVASDSWRMIKVEEQIPFMFLGSRSHTIMKGEPYWKVHFDWDNGGTEVAVMWFDVGNEAFQQVPKQYMPAFDLKSACLVNFRGSFAVVDSQGLSRLQSSILNEGITLWVMEDCFLWSVKFTV